MSAIPARCPAPTDFPGDARPTSRELWARLVAACDHYLTNPTPDTVATVAAALRAVTRRETR